MSSTASKYRENDLIENKKLGFFLVIVLCIGLIAGSILTLAYIRHVNRGDAVVVADLSTVVAGANVPEMTIQPPSAQAQVSLNSTNATAVELYPTDNVQAVVDQYAAGTTFVFTPGVYRMQRIQPRDGDTFTGQSGAILNGALQLTQLTQEDGYWVAVGQTQEGVVQGECMEGYERCSYPEDVFVDNVPLQHVASRAQLTTGTWFFDYANDKIYLTDHYEGRLVETSVTDAAFFGEANGVTISHLTIEKYANPAQHGAINGRTSTAWLVDNVTLRLNHGVGIHLGNQMRLINSNISGNGQMGIGANRISDALVENNEIAANNYAGFRINWEAGATKFARTDGLIVRGNYVHDNAGTGLWTDIDNRNTLYENNLVVNNAGSGIFHEISYDAIIRNNIVMFNGLSKADYMMYGAQILISTSSNAEVYGNQVVVSPEGGKGIGIMQQDRGGGDAPWQGYNNNVHNNTIIYMGSAGVSGVMTDWEEANFWALGDNRFDANTYYLTNPASNRWRWAGQEHTWETLRALGQETNGTLNATLPNDAGAIPVWNALATTQN